VETGLYLDTSGVVFPLIPESPTWDQARAALEELREVFQDFPFAHPYDQSATLAAVLTLVARYAIRGNSPLFPVRATNRGSGKGLLVDCCAVIGTGRPSPRWPQVVDEDEERKRLLCIGLDGDAVTHIDNVTQPFGSAPLDTVLTTGAYKDRLL